MQSISQILEARFKDTFVKLGFPTNSPVILTEATRPEFGDYQVNGIMGIAKALKLNPRELAVKVLEAIELSDIALKVEIAGPGFINIILNNDFLAKQLEKLKPSSNNKPQTVVIDLSSPNLAKEMHVGHLRSTVIGDAIARTYEYLGDKVIRQNHVGDWGTQFGMLIAYLVNETNFTTEHKISDLEKCYREAKLKFDNDESFANLARKYVVILQNWHNEGEEGKKVYSYWQEFNQESLRHCEEIYGRLKVKLSNRDVRGESFYNADLPGIVDTLEQKHLLTISDGAKCVFLTQGELSSNEDTPFIVQKQDGGYLYSTTDLAALRYRVNDLHADKIIYVVDNRQALHFKQLFILGKKAGFAREDTQLIHCAFGTMMNEDGKPFKTRDGGTVKLIDLIDEAVKRALKIVNGRNPEWDDKAKQDLANNLAIGAIKYADLSKNRASDYIFSFDKMLAFEGNTAPYLLYANTRIKSVLNKAELTNCNSLNRIEIIIHEAAEHRLALHLTKFIDTLNLVVVESSPHYLCQYLYNLAVLFMQFYETCPILKAESESIKESRLALSYKSAEILKDGLNILGIETINRM